MLVLMLGFLGPCAFAQEESEEARDYRGGSILLGAFWVGQIESSIVARSENSPVGIYIDLSRDLQLGESVTVPRAIFRYRFSRRHQINFDFYQVNRGRQVVLERTLEIGGQEFPVGVRVNTFADVAVYRAAYTWLFYDQDKVVLGASFGFNVMDFNLGLNAMLSADPIGEGVVGETAGMTAPVPVIGLRLAFRATKKLGLVAAVDVLNVDIGSYRGTLRDSYAALDWRFSKHFSIGGGINTFNFDLALEEDVLSSVRHNYRGALAFVGVHF